MVFSCYCDILQIHKNDRDVNIMPNLFLATQSYGLGLPCLKSPILGTILANLCQFLNSTNPIISAVSKYVFAKDRLERQENDPPTFPTLHNALNLLHNERRYFAEMPTNQDNIQLSSFKPKASSIKSSSWKRHGGYEKGYKRIRNGLD